MRQAIVVNGTGSGSGQREVEDEVTSAHRRGGGAVGPRAQVPTTGDRLPRVLVVGQAVQSRPQLVVPVPRQLIHQFGVPVDVECHAITVSRPVVAAHRRPNAGDRP